MPVPSAGNIGRAVDPFACLPGVIAPADTRQRVAERDSRVAAMQMENPEYKRAAMEQVRAEFLKATGWFDREWYRSRCANADAAAAPLLHYLRHGVRAGIGPNRYIDELGRSSGIDGDPPCSLGGPRARLRAEMRLVSASGLFDADYYREHNPGVVAKGLDPLRHFCEHGWRQLRKPRRDFDVWWYWSCHLDAARSVLNPLVHYALVGQLAGLSTQPPPYAPGRGHVLAVSAPVRRICLLAGYDPDGLVDEHVVALAHALSQFADVYYFGDCTMRDGQLERLDPWVAGRWAQRHGTYDFGSWSALVERVGWDAIARYDELLLVNDSGYLVGELGPVFDKMRARACDWWGLQATKGMYASRNQPANRFEQPVPITRVHGLIDGCRDEPIYDFHVGSYFVAFRRPVIDDPGFRRRLAAVRPERSKARLVRKYEIGLTQYLLGRQFAFDTFIDQLYPLHPMFSLRHFDLIGQGFPLLKRLFLVTNHYDVPGLATWKDKLLAVAPNAPVQRIEANLLRVADHEKLHRSFSIVERNGQALVPVLLDGKAFGAADASLPKFDHWWAFVADPSTGALAGDDRALFEAVCHDRSIKKIVLTRWRNLRLGGSNVIMAPLRSPEGQYHLLRARQVFAGPESNRSLVFPLAAGVHEIFCVGYDPCANEPANGDIAGADANNWLEPMRMSLPRWDLLLQEHGQLPVDLRLECERLRALCEGRRLVLFAPRLTDPRIVARLAIDDVVAGLHAWLRAHNAVLGVRERAAGPAQAWYHALRGPDTLDLSERRFSQFEVLLRDTSVLVADDMDGFAGFVPTGRPTIDFVGTGEPVPSERAGKTGAGVVSRSLAQLIAALDDAFAYIDGDAPGTDADAGARGATSIGGTGNAAYVVAWIRSRQASGVAGAACTP